MRVVLRGKRTQGVLFALAVILFGYALSASPLFFARASRMVGGAAASLSATVPANPYNTLASELAEREAELARREREIQGGAGRTISLSERLAPYSLLASVLLFVLLMVNFYFDWREKRSAKYRISLRS